MKLFERCFLIILVVMIVTGSAWPANAKEEDIAQEHYKKGMSFYNQGKYSEASREFQKAIITRKQEGDEHYKKGLKLYEQGKYQQAQEEFKKAIVKVKKLEEKQPAMDKKEEPQDSAKIKALPDGKKEVLRYLIGEADMLRVRVWQNADLDDDVMVRPDGMISFPLVGDVPAMGRTIDDFRNDLAARLEEYIKYPQVSVSIKKLGGKRVLMLGEIARPGFYTVTGSNTLLEAVGLAGGFTEDAIASSIVHISGGFENPEAKRLNLTKALDKGDMTDNVVLKSDDIVFVPKKFVADVHYILSKMLAPISRGVLDVKDIEDVSQ
ncbi:MAG: polysaccharide biosynthesis/export family protein [Candidatus Omnitrophica bacterium]|nr:polysaccharide biosynthesis/export family protein [Candidatus Omnitrophota bacterium]